MRVRFVRLVMPKKHAFAISRGVSTESKALFVLAEQDGLVGFGEFSVGTADPLSPDEAQRDLAALVNDGIE
ncbi:MAG: hypothetical protein WHU10_10180, partial [Fimbriimonadales bacterium]